MTLSIPYSIEVPKDYFDYVTCSFPLWIKTCLDTWLEQYETISATILSADSAQTAETNSLWAMARLRQGRLMCFVLFRCE